MQEYYLKHKSPMSCPTCTLQFICPRALQHRLHHNASCLPTRAVPGGIWDRTLIEAEVERGLQAAGGGA
jgi:hypothetical protein